jgi:hypothetical protein
MDDSQSYFKDKEHPSHQKALVGSLMAFPKPLFIENSAF